MNHSQQLLSDIVVYNKYARYKQDVSRRETWSEIVDRYVQMMINHYPALKEEILENANYLHERKVLMSMRAAQFAGPAIEKNHSRIYNCSYLPVDHYKAFSEIMFLLLGGTGVGYSVQSIHISKLPVIKKPTKSMKYLIGDSIEGWADSIKVIMKSYFGLNDYLPVFDYSDIREKGSRLITAGGKAPGPEPLKVCLVEIQKILDSKQNGDKLTDLEVHDIICHIANAVLAGGIRRAALISLFDKDSKAMRTCKAGNWWENNPQRGRANNSAVLNRETTTKEEFFDLWKDVKDSFSGEPGIYFTNNNDYGTNPCAEISLRPFTFCNLTEINASGIKTRKELFKRIRVAAFFGTLQAGFVNFHYLRPVWKINTVRDSLIGVGMTGICDGYITKLIAKYDNVLEKGAKLAMRVNKDVAKRIGINTAARVTTIKPSGTTSCVVGTSSGIHAWHANKYIRNMQCAVGDDLYNFFSTYHPDLIKVMDYDKNSAVIGIPQLAPKDAIIRDSETALEMLQRVTKFNIDWVKQGHRRGPNTNNVSATVSLKDNEWEEVGQWMWDNRDSYNGLSVLPYDGGTYADAPFQEVSDEVFNKKLEYIENNTIDLTLINEIQDNTNLTSELACAGGACEIQL